MRTRQRVRRYTSDQLEALTNYKQVREYLKSLIKPMAEFLDHRLEMKLHPHKISIRKLRQGIDYLGYVVLPHHIVLRTKTKRRMFRKINERNKQSYFGLLNHCNSYKLRQDPRFRGDGERVF